MKFRREQLTTLKEGNVPFPYAKIDFKNLHHDKVRINFKYENTDKGKTFEQIEQFEMFSF